MKKNKPMNHFCIIFFILSVFPFSSFTQLAPKQGINAITEKDLREDLYKLASDHFRGREFGTEDELKAAVWLAEKAREAGMLPAGEDGTFFQFFKLQRHRISPLSYVSIDNKQLSLWNEVLIGLTAQTQLNAEIVYVGEGNEENIRKANLEGKIAAIIPTYDNIDLNVSFPEVRFVQRLAINKYAALLLEKKAAGVIFIAQDDFTERAWNEHVHVRMQRGDYRLFNENNLFPGTARLGVFWIKAKNLPKFDNTQTYRLTANIFTESFIYPSVNVIGKTVGTDPVLRDEHVVISSHIDHMGVREVQQGDSIYNGADDNASACVAALAIARAFKKQPAKRSQLYTFFGSEEPYLFGSNFFAKHSTIPVNKMIAVLNADLIGRNSPDSAAILGTNGKNNISDLLTHFALEANNEGPRFLLDTTWDHPDHPERFLFRSDHASFFPLKIPAVFFTSLLHADYHTPKDEAEFIDYKKLRKMTEWMYRVAWKLSNHKDKPVMNSSFNHLPPL